MRLPARIALDDETHLRLLTVDDAEAVAYGVRDSLDHLRPWMPWADDQSASVDFQRERLRKLPAIRARGEEWQYGLFAGDDAFVGSFGLMTRRGPGTFEIGYWVRADAAGHGLATRAAAALTDLALQQETVRRVLIFCDEANVRSAAIPRRLGFRLIRIQTRAPQAVGESGREMMWVKERADARAGHGRAEIGNSP